MPLGCELLGLHVRGLRRYWWVVVFMIHRGLDSRLRGNDGWGRGRDGAGAEAVVGVTELGLCTGCSRNSYRILT